MADYTPEMAAAYRLLKGMTQEQRGFIFCWFCPDCHRYIGPGDKFCHSLGGETEPSCSAG